MGTTTNKGFRWPTPTVGVKPNVAQDIRNLAEDVDARLSGSTSVGSGQDMNVYSAPGMYTGWSWSNSPGGDSATYNLTVLNATGAGDSVNQVAHKIAANDFGWWYRTRTGGNWTGWAKFLDDGLLSKMSMDRTDPGTGALTADWNTATAPGTYRIAASASNVNSPSGSYKYGSLIVSSTINSGVIQMYVTDAALTFYVRQRWQTGWSDWARVVTSNETADTGWMLAPISPAAGWGSLMDPKGHSSSPLVGGVRAVGKFVEYRFQLTRTGGAISSSASGNIGGDPVIANVSPTQWPGLVPASIVDDAFDVIGVQAGVARIDDAGQITISALYPNDSINTNDVIQVSLRFLAG